MATARPVGTRARPPAGASTAPTRARRSSPASPLRAYAGSGSAGSSRVTGRSSTGRGYAARTVGPVLVWMDLEMTGLDPAADVILEIATIVTDDDLAVVADGPDLVVHEPDEALDRMDPFVVDMHTKSKLIDAVRSSTVTLDEAGARTLAFIKEYVREPGVV